MMQLGNFFDFFWGFAHGNGYYESRYAIFLKVQNDFFIALANCIFPFFADFHFVGHVAQFFPYTMGVVSIRG